MPAPLALVAVFFLVDAEPAVAAAGIGAVAILAKVLVLLLFKIYVVPCFLL